MIRASMLLLVFVGVAGIPIHAAENEQAKSARSVLDQWQSKHAQPTERFLHIVCWTPADRPFPAGYRDRLTRMLQHIQNFYAKEMERNGFGKQSFNLQLDPQKRVVMHEVRGRFPTRHYQKSSGNEIRQECLPILKAAGIDANRETIAIFNNLAIWDPKALRFSHKSPYYAGGSYRSGTAWQLDSPELDTRNLARKFPLMFDGEYGRISLGKHNSIFIGGMAHELGHAFGLPHVKARPDQTVRGTALMGSGNRTYGDETRREGRGSFLTFAHALRLASHPQFCGFFEKAEPRPTFSMTDLSITPQGKAIAISGKVEGTPAIYGVIAYFDPEGGGDYDQTSVTAIPSADGSFAMSCDALRPGKSVLKLVPLHANGFVLGSQQLAQLEYPFIVGRNGVPNLDHVQTRLALRPLVQAIASGNTQLVQRLSAEMDDSKAKTIAEVLLDSTPPEKSPAGDDQSPMRSLTDFKADLAQVGWFKPSYNRLPDDSVLLQSGGQLFATGIYAHAPAKHEYQLGGSWDTLQGQVGIAAGHSGTVQFEIQGGGRSLWKSPVIKTPQLASFKVNVKGIDRLKLITTPTEDGANNDWGLWLEPQLLRSPPGK